MWEKGWSLLTLKFAGRGILKDSAQCGRGRGGASPRGKIGRDRIVPFCKVYTEKIRKNRIRRMHCPAIISIAGVGTSKMRGRPMEGNKVGVCLMRHAMKVIR